MAYYVGLLHPAAIVTSGRDWHELRQLNPSRVFAREKLTTSRLMSCSVPQKFDRFWSEKNQVVHDARGLGTDPGHTVFPIIPNCGYET